MKRFLFASSIVLSGLLLLANVTMWVRSYYVQDSWRGWTVHRGQGISSTHGRIVLWRTVPGSGANAVPFGYVRLHPPPDPSIYLAYDQWLSDVQLPGIRLVSGTFNGGTVGGAVLGVICVADSCVRADPVLVASWTHQAKAT